MSEYILLILGAASLGLGAILGYFARQSVAKFQAGSIERTIQEKLSEAKREAQNIILDAKKKAFSLSEQTRKRVEDREKGLAISEKQLERKQGILDQKFADFEEKENNLLREKKEVVRLREEIDKIISQKKEELERISGISREEAKKEIFAEAQKEYQKEFEQKLSRLEKEGEEKIQQRAKEVLSFAVQRLPSSSITELTTTIVSLPDDEIKGRIIGKEGRNIKAFEEATGVELMVDETPNVVFLSSFDPLRREIAKIALERLIKDGRIQPSRIEDIVKDVQEKMPERIQKIGKEAAHRVEVFGLDPRLHQLLGRLKFRTSFGQNVLDHSIEVSILAKSLAEEIGADSKIAAKAGLLHDIGKAVDWQVEGSHIDIGIRILEKFKVENEVIKAMKSHHEDYPYESIEAVLVQTADAISASRPGARKDNTENYLKRLEELENIAKRFPGVKNAYALEAGREIRVFVKNDEVDDFESKKLAQEIAKNIEEELNYPGEVKVVVIRETRVTEYAR